MRRQANHLVAVAAAVLLLVASAFGATVYLKDGRKVEGEIVERTEKEIRVKLASGKVQTIRRADVKSIDEPPAPPPKVDTTETGDAPVDLRTKEYVARLDAPLATVATELVVVRGDHLTADLRRMADAGERTARHFLEVFGADASDVLRGGGDRYGPGRIEVFQFIREDGYLRFCDKVLAQMRDESVDDTRLAFMRRQRGFWIVTPRALAAQYMGPSDFVTSISAAVHKISHQMLTLWKPSGSFMPWWFYEGLASWQEFAILGETRTYCMEPARPDGYTQNGTNEADEEAKARREDGWRVKVKARVAARKEQDLAVLSRLQLNDLVLEDVQQSWSIVDWLSRQQKLREFAVAYKSTRDLSRALESVLGEGTEPAYQQWRQWVLKTY